MKVFNGLTKFIHVLYFLFTLLVFVSGAFINRVIFYEGTMANQYHFPLGVVLISIIIFIVIYHFRKWLSTHDLWFISIFLVLITGIFFLNLKFPENVIDDARIISDSAYEVYQQILQGNFNFTYFDQYYYLKYPWQVALTLFEVGLHLISNGNGTIIFPWINLACVLITYLSGYIILKKLKSNDCLPRNIYGLIISFFIVPLTYSTYLYGWQLGMAFSALSLMVFSLFLLNWLDHRMRFSQFLISLVLWIIACLFKTNYVIIGIAYVLTIICFIFTHQHKKSWILLLIVVIALIFGMNTNTWLYSSLINRHEAGVPKTLYAVTGLSEGPLGNGWYNGYNELYVQQDYDPDAASDIAKDDLSKRISAFMDDPKYCLEFFGEKFVSTFLVKDYQSHAYYYWNQDSTINQNYQTGDFRDLTYTIQNMAFIWIWCGLAILGYLVMKRSSTSIASIFLVFALSLLGASAYHMIFETKAIYIYPWVALMTPFAALGLSTPIEHGWNTQYKLNWRYALGGLTIIIALFMYNQHPLVYEIENLSYTDDQVSLEFNTNASTIYTMSYTPDESFQLGMIEFMTNGANPLGELVITIKDADNKILSSNAYRTESLMINEYWNRFVIDPIELKANHSYLISIEPHMNQDGLSLTCGTYTQQPIVSHLTEQSEHNSPTNLYPNIKFYRFYHGHQSYDYLYDRVRAISTYYPQAQ